MCLADQPHTSDSPTRHWAQRPRNLELRIPRGCLRLAPGASEKTWSLLGLHTGVGFCSATMCHLAKTAARTEAGDLG